MNLTWRDMQHLVVRTSQPGHLSAGDWKTNGVGRRGRDRLSSLFQTEHRLYTHSEGSRWAWHHHTITFCIVTVEKNNTNCNERKDLYLNNLMISYYIYAREGLFFLVWSNYEPLGRFFGISAMLLLAALSSPHPSSCVLSCAPAREIRPHDIKYKKKKYWEIPRGVRGAERLNHRCSMSSCSALSETDIYRHVEVTHCSFNENVRVGRGCCQSSQVWEEK